MRFSDLHTKGRIQIQNRFHPIVFNVALLYNTDYGRPMKPFFIEFQNFWALQTNWANKL